MKQTNKSSKISKKTERSYPINMLPGLIVLLYILIPTFTPNLMAFDTSASKFLALALMNLVGFIFLLTQKQIIRQPDWPGFFFRTKVGIFYTLFLVVSLFSFINAVNVIESILQFTKIVTVFSAVFILSAIFMLDLRYLKWVIIVFTCLLIFDSISVFYYINEFINGKIYSIFSIKTIYSNKNVLASALFVKLPFALWLMNFGNYRLKWLGWIGVLSGITAIFFMATRAFYLGLIILSSLFLIYLLVLYVNKKQKESIRIAGSYILALLIAFLAFTGTKEFLYPKSRETRLTQGVGEQLATIGTSDASIAVRLQSWHWSWQMLKERPLLGVGTGNWKVVELKYENTYNPDFVYTFKAHNDFIETAAETGIIGGLLYLGIFVLLAWAFLRRLFIRKDVEDYLFPFLFLAGSGIAFYSVDAFFNFPADRPEIQVLFSIYVASGIAVNHHFKRTSFKSNQVDKPGKRKNGLIRVPLVLALLVIIGSNYVLYLNFKSSKLQRIVVQEASMGKLKTPSEAMVTGFPWLPDLNSFCEPIASLKARYLFEEGKYQEAICLLRGTHSSPWDSRREYFMAMGFKNLNLPDSALMFAKQAINIKPNHYEFIQLASGILDEKDMTEEIIAYHNTYLSANKKNNQAWVNASNTYYKRGELDKAWELIEEASKHLPTDSLVKQQHAYLHHKKFVEPYMKFFASAVEHFNNKNYSAALSDFNQFIEKVPDQPKARELRAYTYYFLKDYNQCIEEIDAAFLLTGNPALINLRGICHRELNDMEAASKDFEKAMNMGNAEGKSNFENIGKAKAKQ